MDREKRVMLAFGVSFLVLIVWRVAFPPPPTPKTPAPAEVQTQTTPGQPVSRTTPKAVTPTVAPAPAPTRSALPIIQGRKAEEISIENDLYRVTFSTQGAVVKSWLLKKYRDEHDKLLDVVNGPACEKLGFPMSLSLADKTLEKNLNGAIYAATPASGPPKPPAKVEFTYSDGKIQVRKQFSFEAGYELRAEVSVFDGQRYLPVAVAWPGGFGDHSLPPERAALVDRAVYQTAGIGKLKVETLTSSWFGRLFSREAPQQQDRVDIPGPLTLAGQEDRYFAAVFFPDTAEASLQISRQVWTPEGWKGKDNERPRPLATVLGAAQTKPLAFRMFVGPKELGVLRSVKPPLDALVDFGWFAFVAKPLFLGLRYLYDHWVHNYGWAIVILTVFINLAMFPLKLKQIRSAQEMQRIAPLVKSIQEKYKQYKFNDPRKQRMNQEVMKLYQEHHINPLGGCLPMLLQLPFLYGFYRVLDLPIELRHAPWILWLKDLSAPDKFHPWGIPLPILPTVMVISMFVLQKMTPMATADPAQQRMMMIMPLVFGIMFYNFASGLVLYFLTANLVGIAQQAFINKMIPTPQAIPVPRKAAEAKD